MRATSVTFLSITFENVEIQKKEKHKNMIFGEKLMSSFCNFWKFRNTKFVMLKYEIVVRII